MKLLKAIIVGIVIWFSIAMLASCLNWTGSTMKIFSGMIFICCIYWIVLKCFDKIIR